MNGLYPYTSPIIMSDNVFFSNVPVRETGTNAQRQAAYLIAEETASADLGTLLKPTIVTGTFLFAHQIMLDYGYVSQVYSVKFIDIEEHVYWEVSGTANVFVHLLDEIYGVVDIDSMWGYCCAGWGTPYKVQIAYQAGLPTGTSMSSKVLLALSTYSDILLNEILGFGNEAPGDIGVQRFSNQQYSETRVGLIRTAFGSSARAQFASRLLTSLRKNRWVGL